MGNDPNTLENIHFIFNLRNVLIERGLRAPPPPGSPKNLVCGGGDYCALLKLNPPPNPLRGLALHRTSSK